MTMPLRLLFLHGPETALWRCGFDLAQAAAALDIALELGFAGDGLGLIVAAAADTKSLSHRSFASLEMLGIDQVFAPMTANARLQSALPLRRLDAHAWHAWMRRAPLQAW